MIKLSCLAVGLKDELFQGLRSVRPYELTFSASARDLAEAKLLLESVIVQAIIVNGDVSGDLNQFIKEAKALPSRPIVAVLSSDHDLFKDVAHVSFDDKTPLPVVAEKLLQMPLSKRDNSIEIVLQKEKMLDERLAKIFITAGIPPHIKGYQFLREAVKQAVYDPSMINNITKSLYPAVAERFETTPSKVERAIRHAIEVAWSRGKIENINTLYGIKIFSRGDKPTNGELIALVSDKLLIECS